jgi:hypothetical protein
LSPRYGVKCHGLCFPLQHRQNFTVSSKLNRPDQFLLDSTSSRRRQTNCPNPHREECFRWPPIKTLCQKPIKIDILLSHVKLNKMRMVSHPSKQKQLSQKNHAKQIGFFSQNRSESEKPTIDLLKTDCESAFGLLKTDRFQSWSQFPAGL